MLSALGLGRPTLVRRVMLALLAAFCLVWVVLLGRQFYMSGDRAAFDANLAALGEGMAAALAGVDSAAEARAVVVSASVLVNTSYRQSHIPAAVLMQLQDAQGARLFLSPEAGAAALPLRGDARQITDLQRDGQRYRVQQKRTGRWTLLVAAPVLGPGWVLRRMGAELTLDMLIALPLIVLPLWLAVRSGLRPLHQWSAQIKGKGAHDLSALNAAPEYQELQPLAAALDALLAQLRHKVAREASFVHDAAHELRTPMAVISAQAHVLALAPDAGQRAEAEQRMDQALARASHLVQQLLALAQFERDADRPPPAPALLDAAQLARQAMADAAPAAMARELELSLESPDTLMHALDAQAFHTIVSNLLHNAVRYVDAGGQVLVELGLRNGSLILTVSDDGPGIPAAEQELVFERFYRCQRHGAPGSGLGLAIVRQAAARMRGTVRLAPGAHGKGCRFIAELPGGV